MRRCHEIHAALAIKGARPAVCECSVCRNVAALQSATEVVAAVLTHQGSIATFRRSAQVSSDKGLWHCITGYRPKAQSPLAQAITEIAEETAIDARELTLWRRCEILQHGADGRRWWIHAFHFETDTTAIRLNWEHDALEWTSLAGLTCLQTVPWLSHIVETLRIAAFIEEATRGSTQPGRGQRVECA